MVVLTHYFFINNFSAQVTWLAITTSFPPRTFHVRKFAQPVRISTTIIIKNFIDIALLLIGQSIARSYVMKETFIDYEQTSVVTKKHRTNGTVRPRFKIFLKKGFVIPDQRPRLAIITKLLKLHCCYTTLFVHNVSCHI